MKLLTITFLTLLILNPVFAGELGESQASECTKSIHLSRERVLEIRKPSSIEEVLEVEGNSQTASK